VTSRKLLVVFVSCVLIAALGCEKKADKEGAGAPAAPAAPGGAAPAATPPAAATVLDPAKVENPATLTGTVLFEGTPPPRSPVSMVAKPECVERHGGQPVLTDNLIVGSGKGLKDAFVYISKGLEKYKFEPPADPAVIDQKGCMYSPHVFGVQMNQDLKILNSDPFSHNINVKTNNPFNKGMAKDQAPETMKKWFKKRGVPTPVGCDIHAWMSAFACVVEHPYFAVTGEDGKFSIKGLPPGKYTLTVWHEVHPKLVAPKPADIEIEVKAGETKTQDFTYTTK